MPAASSALHGEGGGHADHHHLQDPEDASWAPLRPNGKPSRLRSGPRLTRVVANTLKVESTLSLGATEDGRCNASLQPRLHPFQAPWLRE